MLNQLVNFIEIQQKEGYLSHFQSKIR